VKLSPRNATPFATEIETGMSALPGAAHAGSTLTATLSARPLRQGTDASSTAARNTA